MIYFGSTAPPCTRRSRRSPTKGIDLDMMRVRAFPFADAVVDFILAHDQVFVVEQNRDAQLRTLLVNECALDPARLIPVLHYDGTPITARFIIDAIADGALRCYAAASARRPPNDLSHQAQAASPEAADERARLHAPRLRGLGLDAVRRLRPRLDLSAAIIQACFELDLPPHRVAKLSGIGCSSKTPTYFLGASHGFNSVHGRMPSVLTGANLANRDLIYLGVSGDGDSASIGLGQFAHCLRRGVNMVYIVENNGVYGLTKGQFSATADKGSKSKKGVGNQADRRSTSFGMALLLGATFVARSFSGDKEQLVPLIKAAIEHRGAAFIDVHQPVRRLQQPPGLDQELRLCARAQRGGERTST